MACCCHDTRGLPGAAAEVQHIRVLRQDSNEASKQWISDRSAGGSVRVCLRASCVDVQGTAIIHAKIPMQRQSATPVVSKTRSDIHQRGARPQRQNA